MKTESSFFFSLINNSADIDLSSNRIADRKNNSEFLDSLLAQSKSDLGADVIPLYTFDQTSSQFQLLKIIGLNKPFNIIKQKQSWKGLAWRVAQKRDIVTLTDIWTESSSLVRQSLFRKEGITSYSGIPITKNGLILGVLECFFRQSFQPDPSWYSQLRNTVLQITSIIPIN